MIKKILNTMNSLPHDKALHGFYGLIVYTLLCIVITNWIAFFIIAVLAISKEVYDASQPETHTKDIFDALTTIAVPFVLVVIEIGYESFA